MADPFQQLKFRDPERARKLAHALDLVVKDLGRPVSVMHVCGSHEQAIARFGLRTIFPKALNVIMGPGCPVCVTDCPEIDEAVALARQGVRIATYGDMLRVPGTSRSLADAVADGGDRQRLLGDPGGRDRARAPARRSSSSRAGSRPPRSPPRRCCSSRTCRRTSPC